ncbi:hypothetical protein [Kamptonema formosum]|uniref:hypothetical protein n=1 Tax=Kamptonema formosum TaxID=331992 RepID=UPI00034AF285|nr:hypothetical protein [Oscillatoria sp. PCC 10802]
MNVEDVLEWVENLMVEKTGEPLTPIQEAIITGVWQRQKYPQIAKDFHCSESHVKKEAAKLWEKLAEELGEDLKKSNFRSKLEKRHRVSQAHPQGNCLFQIDTINIGGQFIQTTKDSPTRSPSPADSPQNNHLSPRIDLKDAPAPAIFHNRTAELSTLKQWILHARTRLIAIYGLSEIGKSALAVKLIEDIQTEFDYIIWRSLSNTPTLASLQTELTQFFSQSQHPPLPTVLDYFRSSRCLVILEDLQNIFSPGELAGQYLPGYEDYSKFFKQVATSSHNSCLILLSGEKPRDITALEGDSRLARTLHLQGLGEHAGEIFREKGLTDEEKWSELITLYQGHPSWLNIIASTIVELFNGSVSLFLAGRTHIFLGDLEPLLESHLERLSELETKVSYWLASQDEAVDISQQPADSDLCQSDVWQAIQSLARRSLVEKVQVGARAMFQLNPVFQQYIQCKFK